MSFFKILPVEITFDILSRLPNQSQLNCKLVCATWNNVLRHPSFSRSPSDFSAVDSDYGKLGFLALTFWNEFLWYFEYNENHHLSSTPPIQRLTRINFTPPITHSEFLGSINGLICLARYSQSETAPLCICNPYTKQHVLLPEIKRDWGTDYDQNIYWTSGFGYVSSTNEYKVVRMMLNTGFYNVYVYTVGSGKGWRNIGNFNIGSSVYLYPQPGVFANGALDWLDMELHMIVMFDLVEEKFSEHLSPPHLPAPHSNSDNNRIGVVDGFLFYAMYLVVEESRYRDIWLLKNKNDNHDMKEPAELKSLIWSKEFRIDESELLAITKSGGALTYIYNYLNICDTKASTSKRLVVYEESFSKVFPHKNTMISLKELGEEDTKRVESVEEVMETECHDQTFNQLQEG
ncbi:F-box/kelch-repeat protein At3g06240-like [Papaver somniferum]|uniref:F-box/kelch-repeat protein At3g06240-like n=1 Tax=Papaver somniferum TaxID=3469 RepID=UPI000E705D56|nr:F-box/kelch-repeat protein At3g06240-like [Papaver somniferum]